MAKPIFCLTFFQGTKMEAVAYDDQTMRFDSLLIQGQEYVFFSIGFVPTWEDDMRYMFRLHSDYYVYLSTHYGKCTIEYSWDSPVSSYLLWHSRMFIIWMSSYLQVYISYAYI